MCAAAIIKRKRNWRHNLFYLSEKVTIAHGEKNQSPRDFMMPCHMTSRAHDMSRPIFGFCHGDCRTRDVFESSLLIVAVARIISSLSAEGQVQKIRKKTPSFDSDCPNFPRQVKNKTMSRDGWSRASAEGLQIFLSTHDDSPIEKEIFHKFFKIDKSSLLSSYLSIEIHLPPVFHVHSDELN